MANTKVKYRVLTPGPVLEGTMIDAVASYDRSPSKNGGRNYKTRPKVAENSLSVKSNCYECGTHGPQLSPPDARSEVESVERMQISTAG